MAPERRTSLLRGATLRAYTPALYVCFTNVCSACGYECKLTVKRVNVFGIGVTLPGRAVVRLAATKPCRLQLECFGDQLAKDRVTNLQQNYVVCSLVVYDTVQICRWSPKEAGTQRLHSPELKMQEARSF